MKKMCATTCTEFGGTILELDACLSQRRPRFRIFLARCDGATPLSEALECGPALRDRFGLSQLAGQQ
jgi:hypothetical protein